MFATDSAIRYLAPATPPRDHGPVQLHGGQHRPAVRHQNGDGLGHAGRSRRSTPRRRTPEQVTARVFAGPHDDDRAAAGRTRPGRRLGDLRRVRPSPRPPLGPGRPGRPDRGHLHRARRARPGHLRLSGRRPVRQAGQWIRPGRGRRTARGRRAAGRPRSRRWSSGPAAPSASTPWAPRPIPGATPRSPSPTRRWCCRPGITADIVDDAVVVPAPETEGVFPIKYTVRNSKGLAASGILTVTVSATAPLAPPTAKDVFVDAGALSADGATASVDVSRPSVTNRSGPDHGSDRVDGCLDRIGRTVDGRTDHRAGDRQPAGARLPGDQPGRRHRQGLRGGAAEVRTGAAAAAEPAAGAARGAAAGQRRMSSRSPSPPARPPPCRSLDYVEIDARSDRAGARPARR